MELTVHFKNDEEVGLWKKLDLRQRSDILLFLISMKLLSENNQYKLLEFSRNLLFEQEEEAKKKGTGSAG